MGGVGAPYNHSSVAAPALNNWPKLVQCLPGYNAQTFVHDLVAGVTVGLVALPLVARYGCRPKPAVCWTPMPVSA